MPFSGMDTPEVWETVLCAIVLIFLFGVIIYEDNYAGDDNG